MEAQAANMKPDFPCLVDLLRAASGAVDGKQGQEKKSPGCLTVFAVIIGALVILIIIIVASVPHPETGTSGRSSGIGEPTAAQRSPTGNVANDRLLALPESEQALYLGTVVNAGCRGERASYMGIEPKSRAAFWSVRCRNGASYAVEIEADSLGSTKVLKCSVLKAVAGINCFEKF